MSSYCANEPAGFGSVSVTFLPARDGVPNAILGLWPNTFVFFAAPFWFPSDARSEAFFARSSTRACGLAGLRRLAYAFVHSQKLRFGQFRWRSFVDLGIVVRRAATARHEERDVVVPFVVGDELCLFTPALRVI